jgi:hypothetical protein
MMLAGWMIVLTSVLFACGALVAALAAWKKGHFSDGNRTARRMIEDRKPAPWDARKKK